jgi:hypothetical protein
MATAVEKMDTVQVLDHEREKALLDHRKKLLEHREVESRLKESKYLYLRGGLSASLLSFTIRFDQPSLALHVLQCVNS